MNLIQTLEHQSNLIRNKSEFYNEIEVKPITVGQLIAISPHLAKIQIEDEIKTQEDFHEKVIPNMPKYVEPLRAIFSELFECKFDELLPIDMFNLLLLVLKQMGTESFMNAIICQERLSRTNRTAIIANQDRLSEQKSSIQ